MTENEAIIELKAVMNEEFQTENQEEAYKLAIQALEEIQQYRAIGTVEGYKRAIETSKENYFLYAEYKTKVRDFEAIGTVDEFNALKDAEEQGRLLPYKIGDKFYEPIEWKNCVEECKISSFTIKADGGLKIRLSGTYGVFEITTDKIGKTVFFTKEEAEKELAKVKESNWH